MTSKNVRAKLMTTMDELHCGRITTKEARVMVKAASAVNQSLRFDIENKRENIKLMKATKKTAYKDLAVKPLKL